MTSEHFEVNLPFHRFADTSNALSDAAAVQSFSGGQPRVARDGETLDRERIEVAAPFSIAQIPSHFLTQRGVAVILPAWNEEEIIAETIENVIAALREMTLDFEVIVVDDGSTDQTGSIVDALADSYVWVHVVHNRPNQGYGGALAAGFRAASKELLFFMDADGQFDIYDLAQLILAFERHEGEVVLGYRAHRQDPPLRLLNAWAWKQLVSGLFQFRVRDIDCAFKLMPTALVREADVQSRGAMINTELLAKFARMHVKIAQVPVQHFPRQKGKATGANMQVILRAFRELFGLYGHVRNWVPAITPALAPALSGNQVSHSDAAIPRDDAP